MYSLATLGPALGQRCPGCFCSRVLGGLLRFLVAFCLVASPASPSPFPPFVLLSSFTMALTSALGSSSPRPLVSLTAPSFPSPPASVPCAAFSTPFPCSGLSLTRPTTSSLGTARLSISCAASQPDSTDATIPDPTPTVLEFQRSSNMPVMPPEWKEREEKRKAEEALLNTQGINIRRRPATGPPIHNVGPFQFKIQSEGNIPRNILEEIVWHKDVEVAQMKERIPLTALAKAMTGIGPTKDFVGVLRARALETGYPALIAEVKKASPSRGVIQADFDPVRIAQGYEKGGAACLSVLTDSKYFQGGFENLRLIRDAGVQCPLLCKEFIIDAWQIYKARVSGADAVLLIAAVLPDQDLSYMSKIAKTLGMAALIEVHSEREMKRVLGLPNVELIGINNRSLETFKVDISNTVDLLKGEIGSQIRDRNIIVVGESGLFVPEDIALVREAGVGAVLVGESLVKQDDPCAGIAKLFGKDISRRETTMA